MLRFITDTRDYKKWRILNNETMEPVEIINFNPYLNKLINGDLFKYENNIVTKIHSPSFEMKNIPGVILLNESIYGSIKDKNYYKCIPDDIRLPYCLVPFKIKQGFSKKNINKYIVFKYINWDNKHPIGENIETIGDVTKLNNFYEYQLYCKSLNSSIQNFTKQALLKIKQQTEEYYINEMCKKYNITDRRDHHIITIDPKGSQDLDDAIGYNETINESSDPKLQTYSIISVYITNVPLWIEIMDLWDSFSERIATIYLPDRKRPMLPTILSDCICSLKENTQRIAFTMDIYISNNEIIDIKFLNTLICVTKNYTYEDQLLLKDEGYINIFKNLKLIYKKYKYLQNIKNSHDVITYLMILMNYHCAKSMVIFKNGIYRSVNLKIDSELQTNHLPEKVHKFLKIWNSSSGQYVEYSNILNHELLNLESYIHITSPIRRLVDMLNMVQLMRNLNLVEFNIKCEKFCKKWIQKLDYINSTMRIIRKVQNDCELLHLCSNNEEELMAKIYDGFVFDKVIRSDNIYQYIIYIPDISMTTRLTICDNLDIYQKYDFKLFTFQDEYLLKRKIRLQLHN